MPELSKRVGEFTDSVIRRMTRISDATPGSINLSQGFPDFDPPQVLLDALREMAGGGEQHQYSVTYGSENLRRCIAEKYSPIHGYEIDPETQVVLPLLKSDLLTIMRATVDGTLADTPVEFASGAACCVVLASGGYPVSYKSGYPISGLDEAGKTATVFHAGTKLVDGQIVTAGGRVLGVTATANTLEAAIDKAYQAADKITFTDMHMRRDIGQRALASRKESHS